MQRLKRSMHTPLVLLTDACLGSCSWHARHRCTRAGRQRPDSWQLHSGSLLRLLKRMLTLFPMQRLPSYRNDAYE